MRNIIDIDFIRLKAVAVDANLKIATWGTKEELIRFIIDNRADPYLMNEVNKGYIE